MVNLKDVIHFVYLCQKEGGARGRDLPLATREHDKVRQYARRAGYVVYEDRGQGKRWFATGKPVNATD